jgi:hypothetical protein
MTVQKSLSFQSAYFFTAVIALNTSALLSYFYLQNYMQNYAVVAGANSLDAVQFDTFTLLFISSFIDCRLSVTTKIYIVNKAAYF